MRINSQAMQLVRSRWSKVCSLSLACQRHSRGRARGGRGGAGVKVSHSPTWPAEQGGWGGGTRHTAETMLRGSGLSCASMEDEAQRVHEAPGGGEHRRDAGRWWEEEGRRASIHLEMSHQLLRS